MARVYSERLFRIAGAAGGPTVVFGPVAVGEIWVVRTVSCTVGSNLTAADAWVSADDGGRYWMFHFPGNPSGPGTQVWNGRWVMNALETLSVNTSLPVVADFYASGYRLTLP
jgi:hypothetical protein